MHSGSSQLASTASGADLRQAAAAYIGDLLEGVHLDEPAFDRWLAAEREQLHHRAVSVLSREQKRCIDEGSVDEAIAAALCLLALDPVLEWVHRTLMTLYDQQGRLGAALTQYNNCARIIQQELGVEPEQETRQLWEELLAKRRHGPSPPVAAPQSESASAQEGTGVLPPSALRQRASASPRATVIVLQATSVTRAMLERVLVPASYALVGARTLADALTLANRHANPVILISDEGAPERREAITALWGERDDIPVVVLTAEPPKPTETPAQPLRYVRRPIGADALLGAIAELLARQSQPPASQ